MAERGNRSMKPKMQKPENPLAKYFRQPGIYMPLPSGGRYSRPGDLELDVNGELAILPMTAADEIIIKNPDSLLNGTALERLIHSCAPGVKVPSNLPIVDLDVVMMGIKKVSYGDAMEMTSKCPKCGFVNEFEISIEWLLEQSKDLPDEHFIRCGDDMIVYLTPYTLSSNNRLNLATFEETKMLQNLVGSGVSEEQRLKAFTESYIKITKLNIQLLSESILKIVTPDGEVTDYDFIHEFVMNADKNVVDAIREGVKNLNEYGLPKTVPMTCMNDDVRSDKEREANPDDKEPCGHQYDSEIVYDPVSFFDSASSQRKQSSSQP